MPYSKEERSIRNKEYYEKNKEKKLLKEKIRREEHPEKVKEQKRRGHLKNTFNITIDDYNKIFADQNGYCAICRLHQSNFTKRLAVDHCHTTGKVRGLLCSKCNTAIGSLNDDIDILENAKQYLINNKE
jgi:hypothetical protein